MIGLGLTLLQHVDAFVFMRWLELLRSGLWPGPVCNGRAQYTVQARNLVVEQFLQRDAKPIPGIDQWQPGGLEALLFWDSDQLPPMVVQTAGGIELFTRHQDRLLEENPQAMVIGGLYFSRETQIQTRTDGTVNEWPHEPVAYEQAEDGRYRYLSLERMWNEILPSQGRLRLHQVAGVGTGAMLIRKQLLLELAEAKAPKPIFEAPPTDDGRQWTEDLYFCHQVTSLLGHPIWLDSGGESGHQGDRIWINSSHYLAIRDELMKRTQPPRAVRRLQEREERKTRSGIVLPG